MQAVSPAFETVVQQSVNTPRHALKIAWERSQNPLVTFATVGTSLVGGDDIIQGELDAVVQPDIYQYDEETDGVVEMTTDRRLTEPVGGMALGVANIVLQNTDKRYTPGFDPVIGSYILPNRPIKIYGGFKVSGQDKVLPLLYGLTQTPKENKRNRLVNIAAFDYISYIDDFKLDSVKYTNKRSDEIIADILDTIGFSVDQYQLDQGLNIIGFAYYDKNVRAGSIIQALCEAEEAVFYQDEQGLIRFENRKHYQVAPYNTVVWTIDQDKIIDWQEDESIGVINRVTVKASPRVVQPLQEIWRSGQVIEIHQGESMEFFVNFMNPADDITTPEEDVDYTANTESDSTGTSLTGDLDVGITKFVTSALITLTNNYAGTMYVTLLRLRGTPAVTTAVIEEFFEETDSQDNYGERSLDIQNNFIDTSSFAYYLARALVRKYSSPYRSIRITIPAVLQLQLRDLVSVQDPDTGDYTEYRVMRIQNNLQKIHTQNLTLRAVTDYESDVAAIVGTSLVGGADVVGI
jgi:hypothetical protein